MAFKCSISNFTYTFPDLKSLMAKATPERSGDQLAGISAKDEVERMAAKMILADQPLSLFLEELLIPYEKDEITRLIIDSHNQESFQKISHLTVGDFRNWLLDYSTTGKEMAQISKSLTPEMVAAVSKIMSNQDLMLVAKKCEVVTKFRSTVGLRGHFSTRLQPNHPTDDPKGILASMIDGLSLGIGDAVIGINPVSDSTDSIIRLLEILDEFREKFQIPTQTCVLSHVTTTMEAIRRKAPVDLVFQSIGGTEKTNTSFGISLDMLQDAYEAGLSLKRNPTGNQIMYFETGQGSSLSADAHHGVDQQTCEVRAYAVASAFDPFLVNTVVGFIGPEYLYDGKQIIRAGLEDHFCGKLLGLPMGCDICYTNHANADQDDMDNLLVLLASCGCNYIMGVPGADDIMLNYQSTSYHDALFVRQLLEVRPAPEFEKWLQNMNLMDSKLQIIKGNQKLLGYLKQNEKNP